MDVYLVRHAIAENRHSTRWPDDSERPLSPEGEARFRHAAHGLRRLVPEVALVLSSPYPRAWHTAVLLSEEIAWPAPERCEALEAEASPAAAAEALAERSSSRSVALVGHEPQMSSLASLLLVGHEGALQLELKKGGVMFLAFAGPPTPGGAVLRWSVSPKILRLLEGSR